MGLYVKKHDFLCFFHLKLYRRALGVSPMNTFCYSFFGVTGDHIEHFSEEIVWLPFFSQIDYPGA